MLCIVKLSLKKPPELNSEGLLNLFRYDIYEFSWLKQLGKLFEVENQQLNWLFNDDINEFIRDTNHLHNFFAIDLCFNFFVSQSHFLQFFA